VRFVRGRAYSQLSGSSWLEWLVSLWARSHFGSRLSESCGGCVVKKRHSLTPNKVGSYESNVVAVRLVFFDPRRLLSFLSSCLSHVGSPLGRKDC
jgi:hypothetical protein